MKLLVLAPQWPDPPRQGAAIRNLHILLHLAPRHDVTLLTFSAPGETVRHERLTPLLRHVEVLPQPARTRAERLQTLLQTRLPDMARRLWSHEMADLVRRYARSERYDAVHVEGIEMATYGLLALAEGARLLTYDAHNAEYLLQRRAFTTDIADVVGFAKPSRIPRAAYSLLQWLRLRHYERALCLRSTQLIAVSEEDRRALVRLAPASAGRSTVIPNGVDIDEWSPDAAAVMPPAPVVPDAVVFDGTMDFRPNVDAVVWFVHEVWPLVLSRRPTARFYIVGRNPSPDVMSLAARAGVTVTGAVDDPRPWVAGAAAYVVPMRIGGGVRLKLLQALAMERAVVSTRLGAEGVSARDGESIVLAHSPGAFAGAVSDLLEDAVRRGQIGRAARRFVAERYSWPRILPLLDGVYPP